MTRGSHKDERGVPIPALIHAIDSGTSFMEKQPFLSKAFKSVSKAKAATEAEAARLMQQIIDNT